MSEEQNPHRGSSFDEFLRKDGTYEEVTAKASKRVSAWKLDSGCDTGQDYDPCEGLSMTPKNVFRSVPQFLLGMVCAIPIVIYMVLKGMWRGLVKRTLRKDIAWIKRRQERADRE